MSVNAIALEVTIMSKQDEPDDIASEEEAVMRTFHDIVSALDRGDVDGLAAALARTDDPAPRPTGAMDGASQQTGRWTFRNVFRFMTRNDSASQDTAPR
jgi:hypothetical protein